MRNTSMVAVVDDILSIAGVPNLDITITPGGDALAIRGPCHGIPRYGGTPGGSAVTKGEDIPTGHRIPDLHRTIFTCRGDALAIWRPSHGKYNISMAMIGIDAVSITRIPYLDRRVETATGDVPAIRGPCQA